MIVRNIFDHLRTFLYLQQALFAHDYVSICRDIKNILNIRLCHRSDTFHQSHAPMSDTCMKLWLCASPGIVGDKGQSILKIHLRSARL